MKSHVRSFLACICLCLAGVTANAEVVAVVSASNPVTELSAAQIADIFLGKSSRFPDGRAAVPVDHAEGSPARADFYAQFIGKTVVEMKMHWSKLIFTGRGQPPRQLQDAAAIKALLAQDSAVISYLDRSQVDDTLTVVETR